ncbi:mechanosensitive ion channel family protein [Thiobacillus sp.]|uniref:mechanosensitive ion channel family protein n=1 Tax=Thiobacillus sp. TaxID=924 RepID=UPI00286E6AA1|nr:mechanosensitive ion channel domain-containing protein [Thiobacillus sp.]
MLQTIPLDNLITRLVADSHDYRLLWQIGVLAVCALVAWGVRRQARTWLDESEFAHSAGHEGLKRIGFPLLFLLALLVGREAAELGLRSTPLLDVAVPLLLSLVLVRAVVFSLRYVFEPRESLKTWERLAVWLIWGAFALHLTGLLPRIHAAMEALSFQSGSHRFSLWLLGQAAVVIVVAIILALTLARLLERRLMGLTDMNLSLRMALSKAARTVLLIVAVLVALPTVGIDLTVLSVLGGAIGVGIGFGLQKVASNYISGFIILLDRSVRIGDLVTVDNKYGEVSQINTRYTLLKGLDGTETIVPNETLITQSVINHSLSKPNVRIGIPVQVSYDADLELARELMLDAARAQERVIQDETEYLPKVFLRDFADNGIQMELGVWIRDANEGQGNLRSDINWAIWRGFKAAGIEIPFPQRVIHLSGALAPAINK